MKFISAIIFLLVNSALAKECVNRKTTSKLICYYSKLIEIDNNCECTHIILPANSELKQIEQFKQNYDKNVKFLITVNEFNQVRNKMDIYLLITDLALIKQTNYKNDSSRQSY